MYLSYVNDHHCIKEDNVNHHLGRHQALRSRALSLCGWSCGAADGGENSSRTRCISPRSVDIQSSSSRYSNHKFLQVPNFPCPIAFSFAASCFSQFNMPFLSDVQVPIPNKDLLSWVSDDARIVLSRCSIADHSQMFDDQTYDQDKPVCYIDFLTCSTLTLDLRST